MAKLFRNYNTLTEYEADTNKPVNTVCFIKDAKVIYVDGIRYSYKQLDYLPPATSEAEALEYMGKIIKNAQEVGLIYVKPIPKPVPAIYWTGDSNTVSINYNDYTAESDNITIDGIEYYQLKLDKDLNNDFYNFSNNTFTNLIFKDVDTSNVTNMNSMFYYCSDLTSLDVSKFDTSKVTTMSGMFGNCNALTSLDVSGWDTSNVANMNEMFYYCSALTSLDLSRWDTSKVTNMNYMFSICSALTSLDLNGWNTSNVTDMNNMFSNCGALTSLDLSGWDTSNVTQMSSMFSGCNALTSLDVSNFNTSKVTNMLYMFYGCSALTSLDLSRWDTSKVTDMNGMFGNCNALKTIRMVGCSQTTIDKIKAQLSTDGITGCTIVTE